MVVTHSGPTGLSVAGHVDRELSVVPVHAQIPHQQTVDETVVDWDNLQNCKDVTHIAAQVYTIFMGQSSLRCNCPQRGNILDL